LIENKIKTKMDFRTEWSSWVLVAFMMVVSYLTIPSDYATIGMTLTQVIGLPLLIIALACAPVLIYCYFAKVVPDIDYSIRLAFLYFVYLLIMNYI